MIDFWESVEIFSNEINMKLSQGMNSLMNMMDSQIDRATSSALSDRVIPEIQNFMGSLSTGQRDTSLECPLIIKILVSKQRLKYKSNKEGF